MRLSSRPLIASLSLGVALGMALTGLSFGFGVTHQGCAQGATVGWSGTISAPYALAAPPPGGLVNYSYNFNAPTGPESSSRNTIVPANYSEADTQEMNWTAVSESPVRLPGWGTDVPCPPLKLLPATLIGAFCDGCVLAPGVPGGIGEKTVIPITSSLAGHPTPILNGSYPAVPVGTFSWNISATGELYVNFDNLSEFEGNATPYQPHLGAPYAGLEIHVVVHEVGFGVPIQLLNGSEVTLPSGSPQFLSGSTLTINLAYIFPGAGDNRTWAMFAAGAGSPSPLGGYLFEELT